VVLYLLKYKCRLLDIFCYGSFFLILSNVLYGTDFHEAEKKEKSVVESISYWNDNASTWDEAMGEGSSFQKSLVEPKTLEFLDIQPSMKILDIACGNGQMSRRLAELGAQVVAIDGSSEMIKCAQQRSNGNNIRYQVADVTKSEDLQFLNPSHFDAVLCNMALMDIADIKPVFQLAYRVLKDSGILVFSITHPCFDKAVGPHITEIHENEGALKSIHAIKVERYLTPQVMTARALPSLPSTHFFFHRSLGDYLNAVFESGFAMHAIAEPTFSHQLGLSEHKGWHNLPEIPVVFIAKFKK
jgi:ubiquinone/menaquinone biosynthesis C-methylase UbiE